MFCHLFERFVRLFLSLHFAIQEDKGKHFMHFALDQILHNSILPLFLPQMRSITSEDQSGEGGPYLAGKTVGVLSFPQHMHRTGFFMFALILPWKQYISICSRDQFWRIVKYVRKCRLQAIILAFMLIVNSYDKMVLVLIYHCFCSQGSNVRILPSGSFSLSELKMIVALIKELDKAALGQQCSFP